MQPAPARLSQALRTAFRSARPVHRAGPLRPSCLDTNTRPVQPCRDWRAQFQSKARHYSQAKSDVDRKIEDVKNRIDDTMDSRAEVAADNNRLKIERDETIIHTSPESSSIVYSSSKSASPGTLSSNKSQPSSRRLPSETSSAQSELSHRISHFMDNFQSHIFTASRRLNDLTGYSGIEALKRDIETQEDLVQSTRQRVKVTRDKYAEAIATRSTTQREVNDLLHRKHNWTPTDLERFTSLYRSDHANEQSEGRAQEDLSNAELQYEEASTKLAKSILARYHEEQIWSDKIRHMSTWGTWGLMGLNVLLFVVFQIAIEPWRRRRLVKGFEEKVETALEAEREKSRADMQAFTRGSISTPAATGTVTDVADSIAEAIVDAVSGTTDSDPSSAPSTSTIENAAEQLTSTELAEEKSVREANSRDPSISATTYAAPSASSGFAYYEEAFRELFSERKTVVVTQKELTTVALEGAAGGAALVGLLLVLLRPR